VLFVETPQNILESVALAPAETGSTSFRARQDTYSVVRKHWPNQTAGKAFFFSMNCYLIIFSGYF